MSPFNHLRPPPWPRYTISDIFRECFQESTAQILKEPMNAEQLARDIASLPSAHSALNPLVGDGPSICDKVAMLITKHETLKKTVQETHRALDEVFGSDVGKFRRLPDRIRDCGKSGLGDAQIDDALRLLGVVFNYEQPRYVKLMTIQAELRVIREKTSGIHFQRLADRVGIAAQSVSPKWVAQKAYGNDGRDTYRVSREIRSGVYEIANAHPISKELAERMAEELNRE